MAHAQKPDFVFRRNWRFHLNRRGRQFSRLLAAEVCASAVVMLDTTCSEVVWRVLATNSIRQFPLHFLSHASPCAIEFRLDSTDCGIHSLYRRGTLYRKVNQSHYRSGQALRFLGGWGSQISRQSQHEGDKDFSRTQRPPLPPRKYLVLISVRGWVNPKGIVRPEGLCQWTIPMTPLRIEPATFRLVAQCLNQLRHQQRARLVHDIPSIILCKLCSYLMVAIKIGRNM
jgi:hypothetical protein